MKKNIFYTAILIAGLTFTTTACSNDDDDITQSPIDLECTQNNVASWGNYMKVVATLLKMMQLTYIQIGIIVMRVEIVMLRYSKNITVQLFQVH